MSCEFCGPIAEAGLPRLRNMLCIGGIDVRTQTECLKEGVHMVRYVYCAPKNTCVSACLLTLTTCVSAHKKGVHMVR